MRRHPYSVILFDEIEKAHHDVFNILLQILDDGRVTDSHGRTVNFKNCVIIMTSNIGAQSLIEGIDENGEIAEGAKLDVFQALRSHFRPEFLNRVDEIILFKPLRGEEIRQIVGLMLRDLEHRLSERHIKLEVTQEALDTAARNGYDPVYGARPLKRYLQKNLETMIARKIIEGSVPDDSTIQVDGKDENLTISIVSQ